MISPRYIVIKSLRKTSGYSLQNRGLPQSFIVGPNQTFRWYKFKRDALAAANLLNATVDLTL